MHHSPVAPIKQANKILTALPTPDWERWQRHITSVSLAVDDVLFDSGQKIQHVYFPVSSIISLQYDFEDGGSAEFAQIGNEGLAGIFVFMGNQSTCSKAIVIGKGIAYRIRAEILLEEFNLSGSFRRLILRYMQAIMTQASQMAACNRKHSIDQQLARILLLNLDRVVGMDLSFTHELIAKTMGVRREGISEAAKRLQREGLIDYSRGCITVRDRIALKTHACECYSLLKNEYERLLPTQLAL
jgi:CRP-like cAMP-binding protein